MKSSTKDKVKGSVKEGVGKVPPFSGASSDVHASVHALNGQSKSVSI